MNENIDLTKILKDCPKGFKLYTPLIGKVEFIKVREGVLSILTLHSSGIYLSFTKEGFYFNFTNTDAECLLFPSYEHRDWSKFSAPWYKKEKFDPKTLKPFDKVLVRDNVNVNWNCDFLSHIIDFEHYPYKCIGSGYVYCIPYNDDTKHLVGTTEQAPEYYRYWDN